MAAVDPFEALGVAQGGDASTAVTPSDPYATLGTEPSKAVAAPPAATMAPSVPVTGPTGNFWTDLKNRAGTALASAAAGAVSPLIGRGQWSPQVVPGPTPANPQQAFGNAINTLGVRAYQPETWAGRRAQDVITGGILGALDPAALPATMLGSATAGQAQEALPPNASPATRAAVGMLGFIPGGWAGRTLGNLAIPAGGGIQPTVASTQLPEAFPPATTAGIDPITAQLAKRATDMGIQLAPSQISNDPFIKYLYSTGAKLPFSGAPGFADKQLGQFTRATVNTFGENSDRLTADVLNQAAARLGPVFEGVGQRTSMPMTNADMQKLQQVTDDARVNAPLVADGIETMQNRILQAAMDNNGDLGGKAYLSITARNGPLDKMMSPGADSAIRYAGMQFRNVLDDMLQTNATPEDAAALVDARRQWRNMKTVAPLSVRADTPGGATPSTGVISPAALRGAVNNSFGADNAARMPLGSNDLNDLAAIGQRFVKEPGETGTAIRGAIEKGLHGVGSSLFGGAAAELGARGMETGQWRELASLAATAAINRAVQGGLRTPFVVNRAVDAALNPQGFQFSTMPRVLGPMPFGFTPLQISPPTAATP